MTSGRGSGARESGRGDGAGYSGTPLHRKLGIKPDSRALIAAAPPSFALDTVPPGAVVHTRAARSSYDVVLAFCPDRKRLQSRSSSLAPRITTAGALWIAWPKKSSGVSTDLDENVVREAGLGEGLVDVKVIAIDDVWSGLKFVRRLRDR
ncbi:MAG: hypothetical protein QOJ03_1092 [Frankiaceae bacterium]|nr:hypothetical protein [Frankiaceae bacterium]